MCYPIFIFLASMIEYKEPTVAAPVKIAKDLILGMSDITTLENFEEGFDRVRGTSSAVLESGMIISANIF